MNFRYIIWDFDGTICDTMPALTRAVATVLDRRGVPDPDPGHIREMLRQTMFDTVSAYAARYDLDPTQLHREAQRLFYATPKRQQPPFPGVLDVIDQFEAAGGSNVLYTHHGYDSLMDFMDYYDLGRRFVDVVSERDGFPRKPDPTGFLEVAARHGFSTSEGLAIGDRTLDVEAGRAAGMATCWYGDVSPPEDVPVDYMVNDYAKLPDILGLATDG